MICETKLSPDEMSQAQAMAEGVQAGILSLSPSLNPYQDDTEEHKIWEASRFRALTVRLARMVGA